MTIQEQLTALVGRRVEVTSRYYSLTVWGRLECRDVTGTSFIVRGESYIFPNYRGGIALFETGDIDHIEGSMIVLRTW